MRTATHELIVLGAAALFGLGAFAGCNKTSRTEATATAAPAAEPVVQVDGTKIAKVEVNGSGFVPSTVGAKKGDKLRLEFTRTTDRTCATQVAFPELGITRDLPLNHPVGVEIATDRARKLTFQCGMGMFQSSVVID